ncbi:iron ABC transporter permease [bacterium]|nr:iron ABC transporter permease [bacterium]MCP5462228.1 iron ABC transporter permease [bacterium]
MALKLPVKYGISLIVACIMALPCICVIYGAANVDFSVWYRTVTRYVPYLMVNSVILALTVTCGALVLGGVLAFLVERTDLPLKKFFAPALVTPLIIPCYILALCYVNFFGNKGVGEKLFSFLGLPVTLPAIYGFSGAAFILILGSYPYVYTIIRASIHNIDLTFTEAAQCLGMGRRQRMVSVSLPLLLPAITAGSVLTGLYALSDFGVVSLLRYPTFVSAIYHEINGSYNYSIANALSCFLMLFTFLLLYIQDTLTGRRLFVSAKNHLRPKSIINLKYARIPAACFVIAIIIAGLVLPIGTLMYWSYSASHAASTLSIWAFSWDSLIQSGLNSVLIATVTATACVALSLPVAYLSVREKNNRMIRISAWVAQFGFALPGILVALGVSLVFRFIVPTLNFSIAAIVIALMTHFFSQGFQMISAGINQVSRRLEEGARLLGFSSLKTFGYIILRLIRPALFSAWLIVFLSSMRELPASLLLRPAGFDSLTVKVWLAASEGFYEQAAAPALLLIAASLPLAYSIMHHQHKGAT